MVLLTVQSASSPRSASSSTAAPLVEKMAGMLRRSLETMLERWSWTALVLKKRRKKDLVVWVARSQRIRPGVVPRPATLASNL